MRKLTIVLLVLIALLQYPLWFGKGSWSKVWQYAQQVDALEKRNAYYRQRNETLRAEVGDLKQGQSAIEERARSELGLIKQNEVFYQVMQQPLVHPTGHSPATADHTSVNPATTADSAQRDRPTIQGVTGSPNKLPLSSPTKR